MTYIDTLAERMEDITPDSKEAFRQTLARKFQPYQEWDRWGWTEEGVRRFDIEDGGRKVPNPKAFAVHISEYLQKRQKEFEALNQAANQ